MIQLTMTVTIGDGRVQRIETEEEMEQYATPRDRLEAKQLKMVMKARVQRFARRNQVDGRRARADEVMAAFKTREAAVEWIEKENENDR